MGIDCGFDIFPALEPTEENKRAYRAFLDEVIAKYSETYDPKGCRDDGKVLELPGDPDAKWNKHYICFEVGECPMMPADPEHCGYFLRFSSKISGRLTCCAEPYIKDVYQMARKHFGGRAHFWHEQNEYGTEVDCHGCYDWNEVYDKDRKLRALSLEEESSASGQWDEERKAQDTGL